MCASINSQSVQRLDLVKGMGKNRLCINEAVKSTNLVLTMTLFFYMYCNVSFLTTTKNI